LVIPSAIAGDLTAARISLLVGAVGGAVLYAGLVYGMHANMKRTFMFTVRRLADPSPHLA
ncbi:MAG: hypothetical protein F6K09_39545, partial [Merismopedia sp. SIO2A8]|nr:hypothetical protein [Merismopedia sp. SIO2A8]